MVSKKGRHGEVCVVSKDRHGRNRLYKQRQDTGGKCGE